MTFYITALLLFLIGSHSLPLYSQTLGVDGGTYVDELEIKTEPLPELLRHQTTILYDALVGNIAFQHEQYALAGQHYMLAAQQSHDADLAEQATRSAFLARDYVNAAKYLSYWLTLKPEQVEALHIAFLLAEQKGDLVMGMAYLRQLVVVGNAAGKNGYLEVFQFLSKIKDSKQSLELGRNLTQGHMDDPDALFALSKFEAEANNLKIAEKLIRKALTLRADWDDAQMLLVQILKAQDDKAGARSTLEQLLATKPENNVLRGIYARLLLEQNDLPGATQQFERLYKENPNDGESLFALGLLALQAEKRDEGKKYLEHLYELGTRQDEAAFYLGQIQEESENFADALQWYSRVDADNKFEAQMRIAKIYAKQGKVARAREVLQQIRSQLAKDPTQMSLIEADILREAKQYTTAIGILTTALEKNPGNHELLYARAIIASLVGKIDVLEQDLKFIIDEDPKHVEALNALGYTLASETKRYQEAFLYIQRALELSPNNPAILDSMGWVQYRLGNSNAALTYLKRAVELLQDPEIAAHLGEVLWTVGDKNQALKVWQEALTKTPDSPYILKMQERYGIHLLTPQTLPKPTAPTAPVVQPLATPAAPTTVPAKK